MMLCKIDPLKKSGKHVAVLHSGNASKDFHVNDVKRGIFLDLIVGRKGGVI